MQGLHLGTTAGQRFLVSMFVQVPCSPHPHGAPRFRYMQSRTRVHRTVAMFVQVSCSPHPHGAPHFRYMQSRTRASIQRYLPQPAFRVGKSQTLNATQLSGRVHALSVTESVEV
jgi:hypothetical protein